MHNRGWLILIFSFGIYPICTSAQIRIDSIRVTKSNINYAGPVTPLENFTTQISIAPTPDSSLYIHFKGTGGFGYISFALDTTFNHLYVFENGAMLGQAGDHGWGGWAEGFDRANIYRFGKDYRVYLKGTELSQSGYYYTGEYTERISPGVYKTSQLSSSIWDESWIELIFFGSIPLDVRTAPTAGRFSVYPNPASYIVTITSVSTNEEITFYDIADRKYEMQPIYVTENAHTFDVSKLKNGIYWLQAGSASQKLMIAK